MVFICFYVDFALTFDGIKRKTPPGFIGLTAFLRQVPGRNERCQISFKVYTKFT